jgi:hypothetical protein
MPQIGAATPLTLGQASSVPTQLGNGQVISGVTLANLSGYALQVAFGAFQMWVPPFCTASLPQSQLGSISIVPVNVGAPAGAGLNYVLPTYYLQGEDPPPPGALVAAPLPVELVGSTGGVGVALVGLNDEYPTEIISATGYGTGSGPYLMVQQRTPYQVLVYEASLAAGATVDIIAAIGGEAIRLRNIHVCCDTVPGAGHAVIIHFGSSASANDVGVASSITAQGLVPQDLPYGDWTVGQNSIAEARNVPLYITNAGLDTIEVRVTILYTQSNATGYS